MLLTISIGAVRGIIESVPSLLREVFPGDANRKIVIKTSGEKYYGKRRRKISGG